MDLSFSFGVGGGTSSLSSLDELLGNSSATSSINSRCNVALEPATAIPREVGRVLAIRALHTHLSSFAEVPLPGSLLEKWVFANQCSDSSPDVLIPGPTDEVRADPELIEGLVAAGMPRATAMTATTSLRVLSTRLARRLGSQTVSLKIKTRAARAGMTALSAGKWVVKIRDTHLQALETRFAANSCTCVPGISFHQAVFCLLQRYVAVQGSGFQAACNPEVFSLLSSALGVDTECFASPLNAYFPRFCSAFADTDHLFGSLGSFFEFHPTSGSFEANPPFVAQTILAMSAHIRTLLDRADGPMSFAVVVPYRGKHARSSLEWQAWSSLESSPWQRRHIHLDQKHHGYYEGAQHRRDTLFKLSSCDTSVFILQNDAGAAKWPATDAFCADLRVAFQSKEEDEAPPKSKKRKL